MTQLPVVSFPRPEVPVLKDGMVLAAAYLTTRAAGSATTPENATLLYEYAGALLDVARSLLAGPVVPRSELEKVIEPLEAVRGFIHQTVAQLAEDSPIISQAARELYAVAEALDLCQAALDPMGVLSDLREDHARSLGGRP